jgi:hypothetical protein
VHVPTMRDVEKKMRELCHAPVTALVLDTNVDGFSVTVGSDGRLELRVNSLEVLCHE